MRPVQKDLPHGQRGRHRRDRQIFGIKRADQHGHGGGEGGGLIQRPVEARDDAGQADLHEGVVGDLRREVPAVQRIAVVVPVQAADLFLHLRRHRPPEQLSWKSFKHGMLVCHQAFYVRTDIAKKFPYDLQYRHSADVDWCIRVMREADRQGLTLVNTHTILANFEEGGDTTQHHRDSLKERFKIMMHHYGLVQTVVMHAWFVIRSLFRAGTQA